MDAHGVMAHSKRPDVKSCQFVPWNIHVWVNCDRTIHMAQVSLPGSILDQQELRGHKLFAEAKVRGPDSGGRHRTLVHPIFHWTMVLPAAG
jgi:hypothetical protein